MANLESTRDYHGIESTPEMSEDTPLISSHLVEPLSKNQRRVALAQIFALCWCLFVGGWNDGSVGPLIPRIREDFDVDYQTVSWIFVMTCGGIVLGALTNIRLNDRLGLGKILVLGVLVLSCANMAQTYAPSFPTFVLAFVVSNIGRTILDIQGNTFVALVNHDGDGKMAAIQTAYGLGYLLGPLSAAKFSQTRFWSFHYFVSSLLAVISIPFLLAIFRLKGQDECLQQAGEVIPPHVQTSSADQNKLSQILRLRSVHLFASFLLLYIGTVVTVGGWIVTFMIDERGGGPNSAYISAAFSGGITLGRIVLVPVTQRIGIVNAMYMYTTLAVSSQIVVWLVPSILIDSIAVFSVGFVFGPMYPILLRHTAKVVPRRLVTGSVSWMSGFGAAGSTALPFLTGWMAQRWGIISLQPFLVAMISVMGIVWFLVPKTAVSLP